ncbi:hypothetical protein D3C87_836580 [compost metagenome]
MNLMYRNESLSALKLRPMKITEEITGKKAKNINVLIDLLGYGIVELPVTYRLNFEDSKPRVCHVACEVSLPDVAAHTWLYSPDFKMVFAEIDGGMGHVVTFSGEGLNKNVYYQTMVNVVSDYIFLKEKFFD